MVSYPFSAPDFIIPIPKSAEYRFPIVISDNLLKMIHENLRFFFYI